MDTTFRVVNLVDRSEVGQTASTPELAKLAAIGLSRSCRMGLERTDWIDHFGKPKVHRTVLLEAESQAGEWALGA
jgi:hypothetical protein